MDPKDQTDANKRLCETQIFTLPSRQTRTRSSAGLAENQDFTSFCLEYSVTWQFGADPELGGAEWGRICVRILNYLLM